VAMRCPGASASHGPSVRGDLSRLCGLAVCEVVAETDIVWHVAACAGDGRDMSRDGQAL
jgi:hypothetical protein